MKLVIQIPSFNEEAQLGATLAQLPRQLPGVDVIEWLVIDDGSTDRTAEVARAAGAHHILHFPTHRGLAHAFSAGLEDSLRNGADLIVNTDADNQYRGEDVAALIAPLLAGTADLVIGARPIATIEHFSMAKKWLEWAGSRVVRLLSGVAVVDATSGFRAYSRNAALSVDVFSKYTYTLETLIQAGQLGLAVTSVPVRVNQQTRPSRLARNSAQYVFNATMTILRAFVIYRPFRFFIAPALLLLALAAGLGVRFAYDYVAGTGGQSTAMLIVCAMLLVASIVLVAVAVIADLMSVNRRLLQRMQTYARHLALAKR